MQTDISSVLQSLGIQDINEASSTGKFWNSNDPRNTKSISSPVDGNNIAIARFATASDYENIVHQAAEAFQLWRTWPAPKRGDVIRQFGDALRLEKENLGQLVSYEMGKSFQEGYGE